ncbi:hypothetical protein [Sulfobacillus harzensis]|uniref:Uncharacterized protein n=1 Tax=Sulfobacillus harzensis TaxID=2729629 RepID=A0A7Y0L7S0_9FIRM|nr:hypothetical protein [Sulfobacillus harzensis]NMP24882.1 hypothetical protein [Sulfobacillus harzensis]
MKISVSYVLPLVAVGSIGLYALVTTSHQVASTTTHHPIKARPKRYASAKIQRDVQLGLPIPPKANAPLTQREHWIIVQSAPYGHANQFLKKWNALGQPPLYWSSFENAYYFWVNQLAQQAITLSYTYAPNDPSWYGKPLRP